MRRFALITVILALGSASSVQGQFGKNPLRTNPEAGDTYVISSDKADILYYPAIEQLARIALPIADSCVDLMQQKYQYELPPNERAQIYLFGGQEDYREFWVLPGYPTPPSSGVTEGLKGNMGVVADANIGRMHEVICHEVAHRYQYSMLWRSGKRHLLDRILPTRQKAITPFFAEGEATYVTGKRDPRTEIYVRMLVTNGQIPSLMTMFYDRRSLASYFLGAEFWRYLEGSWRDEVGMDAAQYGLYSRMNFGDEYRLAFFKSLWQYSSISQAIEQIYNAPLTEIESGFKHYLRMRYLPEYANTLPPEALGYRLLTSSSYLVAPAVVAVGEDTLLYYATNTDGYERLVAAKLQVPNIDDRDDIDPATFDGCLRDEEGECRSVRDRAPKPELEIRSKTVFKAGEETCWRFDAHNSGFDVIAVDSTPYVAMVCSNAQTHSVALSVRNGYTGDEIDRYETDDIIWMQSPSFSPDGGRIAFSATHQSGVSDIFVYDRSKNEAIQLTDDVYADYAVDWSPTEDRLVIASDRGVHGDHNRGSTQANLFDYHLDTDKIRYLTSGPWIDRQPRWSPDGTRILFISDRKNSYDLYSVHADRLYLKRITSVNTMMYSGVWWPTSDAMVFAAATTYGPRLFYSDDVRGEPSFSSVHAGAAWQPAWSWDNLLEHPLARVATAKKVPDRYHLTMGRGAGLVGMGGLTSASIQLLYTTQANDKAFHTSMRLLIPSRSMDGFWSEYEIAEASFGYMNMRYRTLWGWNCYRTSNMHFNDIVRHLYFEKDLGCNTYAHYPFSVFRRLELRAFTEYSDRTDYKAVEPPFYERFRDDPGSISYERSGVISGVSAAYVHDNTLSAFYQPVDGMRYRAQCAYAQNWTSGNTDSFSCNMDARKYFRMTRHSAVGARLFGHYAVGETPRPVLFDTNNFMHLYPMWSLYGDRVWMANVDYRFPLAYMWALLTPKGAVFMPPIHAALFADAGQVGLGDTMMSPVLADVGVRAHTYLMGMTLGFNWGYMFSLGGEPLPKQFKGMQFRFSISPNF